MPKRETIISELEKGRAEFAYRCVEELISLKPLKEGKSKEAIENFKEKVKKNLEKEIEKNKKIEEKIDKILENPAAFCSKEVLEKLSKEEKEVIKMYKDYLDNYRSYVRRIPTMILTNGLGQALAFVKAKSKEGNAYELIYSQLTEYLRSNSTARIKMPEDKNDLVGWVISCDSTEYHYITQEILAFLNWLKRFAEGMIEAEETGE